MTTTNPQRDPITIAKPAEIAGTRRGPIGRIAAGSLATGLLGAMSLTLVVFAGAPEHVIAGSGLLAFGLSWAMLAGLASRLTNQPQRWALMPAAVMATTGLGLLILAPGDEAITTAGWIWPPVALAMASWMAVQARQSLHTRARAWLVYPVLALLAVAAVGGGYETVRVTLDRSAYAMPGQSYDVGGHRLHLNCAGSGSPTVVLKSGLGETSPMWSRITTPVSRTSRVCAYDRAGQGWSGTAQHPQDGLAVAADLHTLLGRAGESGPYVLVGHSTGGTYAMSYAAQYPTDVAGMVLLDSASPDQFTVLPDYPAQYTTMRVGLALLPSLGRLGIGQLISSSVGSTLPGPAAAQAHAFATSARDMRSGRDELSTYHDVFTQAQALTTLGSKPLVVLTTTESLQGTRGWSKAQDRMATLSSNSRHSVVDATHPGLLSDQHGAESSVRAIEDVVHSVRTGQPLTSR